MNTNVSLLHNMVYGDRRLTWKYSRGRWSAINLRTVCVTYHPRIYVTYNTWLSPNFSRIVFYAGASMTTLCYYALSVYLCIFVQECLTRVPPHEMPLHVARSPESMAFSVYVRLQ